MDFNCDILVIGGGLSGAVVARELAQSGKKVIICERRNHIGGNMYDFVDEHGILVHKYGPHTFHTNKKELFDYICRYEKWDEYRLYCGAVINGKCTPTPFNFQTIDDFYSTEEAFTLKSHIKKEFNNRTTVTVLEVLNSKDPIVKKYGEFLFKNDYSLYTAKQWGVSPDKIDPSVLKRVPLRLNYEEGYFDDKYQVMPSHSYSKFFDNLLNHENIEVRLGVNAKEFVSVDRVNKKVLINGKETLKPVIYTGAIDELFDCCFGKLPYRSLRFEWNSEKILSKQKYAVVAYPQEENYTRIVEFKKLPVQDNEWTTYEIEYPLNYINNSNQEPYYPVLTEESILLFKKYQKECFLIPNLYLCGRLADFKYYNMDQALEKALQLAERVKNRS